MEKMNVIMNISDSTRGYSVDRFPITIGAQIDAYINVTISGSTLNHHPIVICSTEQTTVFTAHAYNVGASSFTIVVHRMDNDSIPSADYPQSFYVNVAIFY